MPSPTANGSKFLFWIIQALVGVLLMGGSFWAKSMHTDLHELRSKIEANKDDLNRRFSKLQPEISAMRAEFKTRLDAIDSKLDDLKRDRVRDHGHDDRRRR